MGGTLKYILILVTLFFSIQSYSQTLVKVTCLQKTEDGLGQIPEKKFLMDIGQVEDGLPLVALNVDDQDQTAKVTQFQFEVNRGMITSHFVWVEKAAPVQNEVNLTENRLLNIAKMVTIPPANADGNATYQLTRVIRNVDVDNSDATVVRVSYVCDEPQIL